MTGEATDPRTDPNAVVESSGGLITRTRGEARDMDLQHKGLRTYPDGRTVFQSVVVTVPERDDRRGFTISGDEAEVTKDSAQVRVNGHVRLQTSDNLTMNGRRGDLRFDRRHHPHPRPGHLHQGDARRAPRSARPTTTRATCCGCSNAR